jgi:hypothetical protein
LDYQLGGPQGAPQFAFWSDSGVHLLHEIWKTSELDGGPGLMMSLATDKHDARRLLTEPNAVLAHSFRATSYFQAMQLYYDWNGWGTYHPEPGWDDIIYTPAWLKSQGLVMAARNGT